MAPSINLKTAIPGPKSKEVVARREAAVPSGLYKAHPIAIESAKGALVTDVDGNTLRQRARAPEADEQSLQAEPGR